MNEKNPITNVSDSIKSAAGAAVVIAILLAFVMCLVAPIFEPYIKQCKRRYYVLYDDCEKRAEQDMKSIRVMLWAIAVIGWIVLGLLQLRHY
jgi:hypothetical protein